MGPPERKLGIPRREITIFAVALLTLLTASCAKEEEPLSYVIGGEVQDLARKCEILESPVDATYHRKVFINSEAQVVDQFEKAHGGWQVDVTRGSQFRTVVKLHEVREGYAVEKESIEFVKYDQEKSVSFPIRIFFPEFQKEFLVCEDGSFGLVDVEVDEATKTPVLTQTPIPSPFPTKPTPVSTQGVPLITATPIPSLKGVYFCNDVFTWVEEPIVCANMPEKDFVATGEPYTALLQRADGINFDFDWCDKDFTDYDGVFTCYLYESNFRDDDGFIRSFRLELRNRDSEIALERILGYPAEEK